MQRLTTPGRLIACCLAAIAGALYVGTPATAHESDAVSDPPSGSVVDEPISDVTIEFGVDIADDIELALFGPGDDQIVEPTTTTVTAANAAMIEFEPLEQQGTYIVRYLGRAPIDGHTIVGAVSFTYGSSGGGSSTSWVWFLLAMIPILAIGTAWSYRLHKRQQAGDESEVDEDLSDVGV